MPDGKVSDINMGLIAGISQCQQINAALSLSSIVSDTNVSVSAEAQSLCNLIGQVPDFLAQSGVNITFISTVPNGGSPQLQQIITFLGDSTMVILSGLHPNNETSDAQVIVDGHTSNLHIESFAQLRGSAPAHGCGRGQRRRSLLGHPEMDVPHHRRLISVADCENIEKACQAISFALQFGLCADLDAELVLFFCSPPEVLTPPGAAGCAFFVTVAAVCAVNAMDGNSPGGLQCSGLLNDVG